MTFAFLSALGDTRTHSTSKKDGRDHHGGSVRAIARGASPSAAQIGLSPLIPWSKISSI